MPYGWIAALVAALMLGAVVGMVTFKRSLRWCPTCGAVLRCPECASCSSNRYRRAGRNERSHEP